MVNEEVREYLKEFSPNALIFDTPSFDNSIIGTTYDGRVVYDYDKMCEEYAKEYDSDIVDAADAISYDTLRTLPYMGEMRPMVITPLRM